MDLWTDAACRGMDPNLFYVPQGTVLGRYGSPGDFDLAKAICASCPVREDCREYALRNKELEGVWGGMDEDERRNLRAIPTTLTYCSHGHLLDSENLYIYRGRRICRICRSEYKADLAQRTRTARAVLKMA